MAEADAWMSKTEIAELITRYAGLNDTADWEAVAVGPMIGQPQAMKRAPCSTACAIAAWPASFGWNLSLVPSHVGSPAGPW